MITKAQKQVHEETKKLDPKIKIFMIIDQQEQMNYLRTIGARELIIYNNKIYKATKNNYTHDYYDYTHLIESCEPQNDFRGFVMTIIARGNNDTKTK